MHMFLTYVAAAAAAPAAAQAATPAVGATAKAAAAAPAAVDAERLRLGRQTVEFIWPLGTYKRMMGDTMDQMVDGMMAAVFDMKMGDMVDADEAKMSEEDQAIAKTTMREALATKDPHFEERMRITNKVMMSEMGAIMSKVEPAVRDGLANVYARKFTAAQLQDLNRFFETPTGRFYAAESMMLFMDPEVMKSSMAMVPDLMKAMPAIGEKVKQATAHLPPPPSEQEEEGEEAEAEDSTA